MTLALEQIELRRRELVLSRAEFDWREPLAPAVRGERDGPSCDDVERDLRDARIWAMHCEGFLLREIATACDVNPATVTRILKRGQK